MSTIPSNPRSSDSNLASSPPRRPSLSPFAPGGIPRRPSLPVRTHKRAPSADYRKAQDAKRRWEDDSGDDLSIGPAGTVSTSPSSRASYTTRRKRAWRSNNKASTRAAARLRAKPEFDFIAVDTVDEFYRHYKKGFQFADPDPLVAEFVAECGTPSDTCQPEGVCFMLPCDDVQMNHLKHFDRPSRDLNPKYAQQYKLALMAVTQLLELDEKIEFPHAEDLENVRYKASKFPGSVYRKMGFKTRGEAQDVALAEAKLAFAQLMDGDHVEPHPVRLGGRGKAVETSESSARAAGVPKGRLILMLSQRDLLLCGVTEQLLTDAYCSDDFPMSLGMGWFRGNARRFSERYAGAKKFFCFDAAKFDSSLDEYLVRDAVTILRRQFRNGLDERYDAYWEFVVQSLIFAPIQRDDGWVMFKTCGTTSGHNHNTIVQSIDSLIIAYTNYFILLEDVPPSLILDDLATETLGDDNITASKKLLMNVTVEQVAEVAKEAFGQDYFGDKSFATTALLDPFDGDEQFSEEHAFQGVQYLGKYLRAHVVQSNGREVTVALPYRPVKETFIHMYYPERKGHSIERTYQRALGNLLDNYGNPLAAKWLNELLDWLEAKMEFIPNIWLPDTVQDAARDYTADQVVVPRMRRWTFDEWVVLCLVDNGNDPEWYEVA
nr:MAG: putative RNA-dependent RNA polymerase [Trichoderma harzianum dsRNA virus 1]